MDFPKVLKKMARPGECSEKSVDLHEVLNYLARAAEKSTTIVDKNNSLPSLDYLDVRYIQNLTMNRKLFEKYKITIFEK